MADLSQFAMAGMLLAGIHYLDSSGVSLPQPVSPPIPSSQQPSQQVWTMNATPTAIEPVAVQDYRIVRKQRKSKVRINEKLPAVVAETAKYYSRCGVSPSVFLGIAWHERGMVHGWFDDYLFGYGAFDHGNWGEKYRGWESQWRYASRKICGHFSNIPSPTIDTFQDFARDVYKTTNWQHYRNAYLHHLKFKEQFE